MALLMIPLLPRILIHAKLRMTEFVIIGKIEAERRRPLTAADEIRRRDTAHHTDKGGDDRDLHGSQKDLSVILVLKKVHVRAERVIPRKHAWNQNAKQRDHQEQK